MTGTPLSVRTILWLGLCCAGAVVASAAEVRTLEFSVRNNRGTACDEVVRVSLPVPAGLVPAEPPRSVLLDGERIPAQARVITRHADGSVRRVMLSFPCRLEATSSTHVAWPTATAAEDASGSDLARVDQSAATVRTARLDLVVRADGVRIIAKDGAALGVIRAVGPSPADARAPTLNVIENGPSCAWLRWRQDGSDYDREWDVEVDEKGRIRLAHRILRHVAGNGWTPDFGFDVSAPGAEPVRLPQQPVRYGALPVADPIHRHPQLCAAITLADGTPLSLVNPFALRQHRGSLEARRTGGATTLLFRRTEPVAADRDNLLLQEGMWQTMTLLVQPGSPEELARVVDEPLVPTVPWQAFDAVYRTGPPLDVKNPVLRDLAETYVTAITALQLHGDDWGSLGGLERYNHCPYIWEDFFRSGDPRLRRVAVDYSENYHNFSIYWGPTQESYGGGRYPPNGQTQPWPGSFRTRHNNACTFCTKGYHGFWLAYEETGDPRFRVAAERQARWSADHVHATVNFTRCIGQVADFVKLYEYTGDRAHLDQAERLWTEFQACQNPDLLFNERGVPSTGNDLYILDDQLGYQHPFVKAYIVQYATNALPYLQAHRPGDARLRDTIVACNDWMARVQTAGGGWSYPGPTTAGFGWQIEYCHGLMRGYEVEPKDSYLDAVQRDIRTIAALFQKHRAIPFKVEPWEYLVGKSATDLGRLYRLGIDRDRDRDFTDGRVDFGVSPDQAVYFRVVLRDYLRFRPEESLFTPDNVLDRILRMPASGTGN